MATKFDKEMMKKQHFWLLLIPLFIGLLLAWLGLFFGVAEATQDKLEANEKEKKGIEAAKAQAKALLGAYDKRKEELFGLRTQRWKEMWDLQQAIFEWPDSLGEEQIAKVRNLKFGDEIADPLFKDMYRDQGMKGYEKLAKDVAPIQFAGEWRTALRNVPSWKRNPESEDIWLATEDYWVQRELLMALESVNKDAAQFRRPSDFAENDPRHALKNEPRERTFIGRTWQLELKLTDKPEGPMIEGFITNLTSRLQPFNVTNELLFNVWLSDDKDSKPFVFSVEGATLDGGKREQIKPIPRKHTVREGRTIELFKVEQVFDVRTAPVKRVDRVALGQTSDRHRQAELQMTGFSTKAVEAETAAASATGGGAANGGATSGGAGSASGPPMGIGTGATLGGGAGGATSGDMTYNGLARRRYVNITGQVRAMPVGLVVIADQGFVQDVLTAIANSKLRFQTVQTTLSRFRGSLSYLPQSTGSGPPSVGSPPPAGMPPGEGAVGPPGSRLPGRPGAGAPGSAGGPPSTGPTPGMMGPGMFGPGMFGGSGPLSSSDDQTAGNLIEVTLYGIASVYEKFDQATAKKDEAAAGTPADAGMPPTAPTTPKGTDPATPMPPAGPAPTTPMPPTTPAPAAPPTPPKV
jgi:hypothetical protein